MDTPRSKFLNRWRAERQFLEKRNAFMISNKAVEKIFPVVIPIPSIGKAGWQDSFQENLHLQDYLAWDPQLSDKRNRNPFHIHPSPNAITLYQPACVQDLRARYLHPRKSLCLPRYWSFNKSWTV